MKKKIITQKKSFFFEDYNASEIEAYYTQSPHIKISIDRVNFLFSIFIILILIFSLKITYLALSEDKNYYSKIENKVFVQKRRNIVDRNGSVLATNINLYDVGVRPKLLKDKDKKNLLLKLSLLFPELNLEKIKKNLSKENFFWLEKRLTPREKDEFWLMANKAFVFELKSSRIYPQKNLFSHILGQTDDVNNGISGLEKSYDVELNNKDKINTPVALTLDSNLQHLIRSELINAKLNFNNVGSGAILMDIKNGNILSLVSLPDYDLNQRLSIFSEKYTNKITHGVYELGSVFKTFTIAAGLENKIIKPETEFKNLEHSLSCDKYTISEHDKLPKNLSTEEILIRSSNIGAVRIAQKIGIEKYKNFLNSLGLLKKINFDLQEIGEPIPFKWGKCKLATASFGHGITTTPLQLAKAYAILTNGGYEINPSIFKKILRKIIEKKSYLTKQVKK